MISQCHLNKFYFIAEPIVDRAGKIVAFEILTRFTDKRSPYDHIINMSLNEKKKLFLSQLSEIVRKKTFFLLNKINCSINVDYDLAAYLIGDSTLRRKISSFSFIRIEVSERFPGLSEGFRNPMLRRLHDDFILWLDDFGSEFYDINAIQNELYETIKIDKKYFWDNRLKKRWQDNIRNIYIKCSSIIVEGVAEKAYIPTLPAQITAMQGYLFKSVRLDSIEKTDISQYEVKY